MIILILRLVPFKMNTQIVINRIEENDYRYDMLHTISLKYYDGENNETVVEIEYQNSYTKDFRITYSNGEYRYEIYDYDYESNRNVLVYQKVYRN
jgi:hypothetical protein